MKPIDLKISNQAAHFKKGINVAEKYSPEEKVKLAKASKEFESMLTNMMLKSMTKTTEGLFGKDNYGGDVLDVLFEKELSNHITDQQGMGVAEQIYNSLTGESITSLQNLVSKVAVSPISLSSIDSKSKSVSVKNSKVNSSALNRVQEFEELIDSASKKYNVDSQLIKSVILTESAGKVDAQSKANAKGLMQLMDSTATDMGVNNPWNPQENIFGGTKYLSKLLDDFDGDTDLALAAYNAGPGNVKKYNGIPPFKETQNYIKRVNNYLNLLD